MTIQSGPIYEVTFFVDPVVAEAFDLWLQDHVRASLAEPGMVECNNFSIADGDDGRVRRVCLHVLESDAALDDFLVGRGTDIDTELVAHFPQQADSQGRVLREDQSPDLVPGASPDCLNCGTRLRGQYCGNCGQRSRSRLISLWELISDAFGDLFEIDSRLWQTLIPLLMRPGRLTHDYLQGRRARYMPPFRMYLVLSLLFFVVAFFDPRDELGLLFEPQPELTSEEDIERGRRRKKRKSSTIWPKAALLVVTSCPTTPTSVRMASASTFDIDTATTIATATSMPRISMTCRTGSHAV